MFKVFRNLSHTLGSRLCRFGDYAVDSHFQDFNGNYKEITLYRGLTAKGQISIDEGVFLGELLQESDPDRPIIEIGTLYGFSALLMTFFKPKSQRLITVDNYSWNSLGMSSGTQRRVVRERLKEAIEHHNVEVVEMDKNAFYEAYDGPAPALFFCDANHSYTETLADINWARSVGANIICGDDHNSQDCPEVVRAVEAAGGARKVVGDVFLL